MSVSIGGNMATAAKKVARKTPTRKTRRNKPVPATFKRTPKVPNFSEAAIYIADICARESWIGNSYTNGKPIVPNNSLNFESIGEDGEVIETICRDHVSDEGFVIIYATELFQRAQIIDLPDWRKKSTINFYNLERLIKAAELSSAINTKRNKTDVDQGLNFLKNELVDRYRIWSRRHHKEPQRHIARDMVIDLSNQLNIYDNGEYIGNQPALASRLLNFGFPDLGVYNFSQTIRLGLKLSSPDVQEVLIDYYKLLDEGYRRNWNTLAKFTMPPSQAMSQTVWQRAYNGGWWQRRVYDLALKMYFSDKGSNYFPQFSPKVQENIFVTARAFP
jgi:hypothetical protein